MMIKKILQIQIRIETTKNITNTPILVRYHSQNINSNSEEYIQKNISKTKNGYSKFTK